MRVFLSFLLFATAFTAPCRSQIIIDASSGVSGPFGLTVDSAGNVYVGDLAHNVFKITPGGVITTVIDAATVDPQGNSLGHPLGLTTDSADNLYVSALAEAAVYKITPGGLITRLIDSTGDGQGNVFFGPRGLKVDGAGNVYVVGENSDNAFKITPGGVITEIIDATGDGTGNPLDFPWAVDLDAAGNVYVIGQKANALPGQVLGGAVFKITPGGTITTIMDASGDGAGNEIDQPRGLAVDQAGNVFVAGFQSGNVFKITPAGVITEVIDSTGDGAGNTLTSAYQIAVDGAGNLYVPNYEISAGSVFKVTPGGVITEILDASSGIIAPSIVAVNGSGSAAYVLGSQSNNVAKICLDVNEPPVADAGVDQAAHLSDTINLDGSASFDDNTASPSLDYAWSFSTLPAGSLATLSGADTAAPSFVADVQGCYGILLVVTDEGGLSSAADEVIVDTNNLAPTADAGDGGLVVVGAAFLFDGSGSTDPEGDILTFAWAITSAPAGSVASLSGAGTTFPTLVPDVAGLYEVTLVVSDFIGPGGPDTVQITASTVADYAELQLACAANIVAGLSPGQVTTKGNKKAFLNFLRQAAEAIQAGDTAEAVDKINKCIARTNGCAENGSPDGNGPGRDWITDCAAQAQVLQCLLDALAALSQ